LAQIVISWMRPLVNLEQFTNFTNTPNISSLITLEYNPQCKGRLRNLILSNNGELVY
jgi:hypothetical protein